MQTIGLIGGMSWESTQTYYKLINRQINTQLGGLHSAKILINSLDFAEIARLQQQQAWPELANILAAAAHKLATAGADCVLICSNTMHKVADIVSQDLPIPLLHIADATATELHSRNLTHVGLLGTKFTMEQEFYRARLSDKYGITVITPPVEQRDMVHGVIYQQLCRGIIDEAARQRYLEVIEQLQQRGAQGIILGCTEIGLLVQQSDTSVVLFDTTAIHTRAAVNFALAEHPAQ